MSTAHKTYHIHTHTELGDLLVCEAILRHYAAIGKKVYFDLQPRYLREAAQLFAGLNNVFPLPRKKQYPSRHGTHADADEVIGLGYYSNDFQKNGRVFPANGVRTFDPVSWDREFYRQAGLPFLMRWSSVKLPSISTCVQVECNDAVLVHDEPGHDIFLDVPHAKIYPVENHTVFGWMGAITKAKQIHCIDSSIMSLIESMFAMGYLNEYTELFFHRSVRHTHPPTLMAPWKIVE